MQNVPLVLRTLEGRTLLVERNDVEALASDAPLLVRCRVDRETDLAMCRARLKGLCATRGVTGDRLRDTLLATGEALTNGLVHAGGASMEVRTQPSRLQVWIRDQGTGIGVRLLPFVLLTRGFSTRVASLGMGFAMMRAFADRLYLCTDAKGTVVVLEFKLPRP